MRIMTCCKTNSGGLEVQVISAFANKTQITFFFELFLVLIFEKNPIDTRESLLVAIELRFLFECSKILTHK